MRTCPSNEAAWSAAAGRIGGRPCRRIIERPGESVSGRARDGASGAAGGEDGERKTPNRDARFLMGNRVLRALAKLTVRRENEENEPEREPARRALRRGEASRRDTGQEEGDENRVSRDNSGSS